MTDEQRDCRACALEACQRVSLYPSDMKVNEFVTRACQELVAAQELSCPIGPANYTEGLLTFREHFRACLEAKGYQGFAVFLQALCHTEPSQPAVPATWATWCDFHADRL